MEKMVYLFLTSRYTRSDVENIRSSDVREYCDAIMTMQELESHWNDRRNGGLTMDIRKYWVRIV